VFIVLAKSISKEGITRLGSSQCCENHTPTWIIQSNSFLLNP